MKTIYWIILGFAISLAPISTSAQLGRMMNPSIGTWIAGPDANRAGLPSRIKISRLGGAMVDGKRCKWQANEEQGGLAGIYTYTLYFSVIDCPGMGLVSVRVLSPDINRDKALVQFGNQGIYEYFNPEIVEKQLRKSQEPVRQKWGQ